MPMLPTQNDAEAGAAPDGGRRPTGGGGARLGIVLSGEHGHEREDPSAPAGLNSRGGRCLIIVGTEGFRPGLSIGMAQTAWVAMTRGKAARQPPKTVRPRVDAGVKELSEMTIGRTDDPENPLVATAFEAVSMFGTGSRTPSGPAVRCRATGRTHDRNRSARQNTHFSSCIRGAVL